MRLGRVQISHSYVVDLDNPEMVEHGKDALYEDMMNAYKYEELWSNIDAVEAPDANEDDIPEFLLPEEEEEA